MASGYLDQQRDRVYEDLSGLIKGKVLRSPVYLELFASDAGLFHIPPLVVVRPQSSADVVACLQYCSDRRIPVHARGAGTGCAGESLGPGVVIDFSAYLRRTSVLDPQASYVRVQPGATFDRLQAQLERYQRMLPFDPGHIGVSTLGGAYARCRRGSRSHHYGPICDWIREVTVCLADGTRLHLGRENLLEHASAPALSVKSRLVNEIAQALRQYESLPKAHQIQVKGCGYHIDNVLSNGCLDFAKLLVGSEGTLALVLEMTFETLPTPPARSLILLLFPQLEPAFEAAIEILRFRPTMCDLMDRRHLSLARESDEHLEQLVPDNTEAAILVEIEGQTLRETYNELRTILDSLRNYHHFDFSARWANTEDEIASFCRLARITQPVTRRASHRFRPLPVADNVSIEPERMASCVSKLQAILRKHDVASSVYCHVGDGVIYLQPFFDTQDRHLFRKMKQVADEVYGYVLSVGGGIGPTLGCGLARTPYMKQQWGHLYPIFEKIKKAFDPLNILNPGKIIETPDTGDIWKLARGRLFVGFEAPSSEDDGNEDGAGFQRTGVHTTQGATSLPETQSRGERQDDIPAPAASTAGVIDFGDRAAAEIDSQHYSYSPPSELTLNAPPTSQQDHIPGRLDDRSENLPRILESQLDWQPDLVANAVSRCSGCGDCRTQDHRVRMCPLFRALPWEECAPRSKSSLMRAVLTETLPLQSLTLQDFREICDLCVHCHSCRIECSAQVDIPLLASEAKAAYTLAHGSAFADWLLNRIDGLASLLSRFAPLVNWGLANRQVRWLLEKLTGISQVRKLPRLHAVSFLHRAARKKLHRLDRLPGRKVVYFVDVYANWFDPALAEALVAILAHHGISVFVPLQQRSAGTAAIASGEMNLARRHARLNVAILAEAVRQGCEIVTTEPAAALTLIHEYPQLLQDEDSQLVAKHTHDAGEFLLGLHRDGQLRTDFQTLPLRLGYHLPCRLRALGVGQPGRELLELIPGVTVEGLPNTCSGMAGMFGIKAKNFRTSLRLGWSIISHLRDPAIQAASTECSACRIQLEQGTTKPTLHPIKVLAAAYGLWPGGLQRLLRPGSSFVLS